MATDQKVEQVWETPVAGGDPEDHQDARVGMETTDDDAVWVQVGMHHVLVRTVGRKSGNEHKIALPYWVDPDGVRMVVASFAGAEKHPAWFLNLRDRDANPEVLVRVQSGEFWSVPDILEDGDEHDRIWALLIEDRAWYNDYQAKTERTIPLVRFPETRPV